MTIASRPIQAGSQLPVVANSIFTPVGGHFPLNDASPVNISSATVISPGLFGINTTADKVEIQTTSQNVRFTLSEGSIPTATTGFQLKTTDPPLPITLTPGVVLTVIEEAPTAAINFQFGR